MSPNLRNKSNYITKTYTNKDILMAMTQRRFPRQYKPVNTSKLFKLCQCLDPVNFQHSTPEMDSPEMYTHVYDTQIDNIV